jgi:hypothetical protein
MSEIKRKRLRDIRDALPSPTIDSTDLAYLSVADEPGDKAVTVTEIMEHIGATPATADKLVLRDSNGRAQITTPSADADIANKGYVDSLIDADVEATPNTLIIRDDDGRAQITTPSADADIANKGYVDSLIDADVEATPNTLIIRDASGRAQITTPSADADIANKGYVDGLYSTSKTTRAINVNYLAESFGFITVKFTIMWTFEEDVHVRVLSDDASIPTTIIGRGGVCTPNNSYNYSHHTFSVPIIKGHYYRIETNTTIDDLEIKWTPIG